MLKVQKQNKLTILLIYLILAVATFTAYQQIVYNDFVWDDHLYITNNPHVKCGITRESVVWAFSTSYAGNWLPVTFLSHMLDCELFGLNPFWHHLTNLSFHIVNTLLLFWVLKRMTGAVWRSAFVAAVFALHPLHVESVAWVAERKDLLCGLFFILTIAAYIRYAQRPSFGRYLLVMLVFVLGLMAKPMMVTLPFVLLLLDYWPLRRFQWSWHGAKKISPLADTMNICYQKTAIWRLICEKIPLFIFTVASAIVTFIAQQKGGAMEMLDNLSINLLIANAIISYVGYISKMVYPCCLAVLYPYSYDSLLTWQPIASFLVIATITISVIYLARRQRHYLTVGWLWYLGTLVPVIGLVQIGVQGMADRYTYLPSIGLFIMATWGADELFSKRPYPKVVPAISAGLVVIALLICTRIQIRYWRNNFTLFERAVEVTENNYLAHYNLGNILRLHKMTDEAMSHYRRVLQIKPNHADAHNNLGGLLLAQGKLDEAISHFRETLRLKPNDADVLLNLGKALSAQGKFDEAIIHYRQVIQLRPNYLPPLNRLAWILATNPDPNLRDPKQAIEFAKRAAELTNYQNQTILSTLAAAYAAAGQFPQAIEIAKKALELAKSAHKKKLEENIRNCLLMFEAGQSYIDNGKSTSIQ